MGNSIMNTPLNKEVEDILTTFAAETLNEYAKEPTEVLMTPIANKAITALNDHYTQLFLEMVEDTYKMYYYKKGDNPIETADNILSVDRECEIREEFRAELRNKIKELKEGSE